MKTPVFLTFGIISINLLIAVTFLLIIFQSPKLVWEFITRMPLNLSIGIIGLYISGKFIAEWMSSIIQKVKYISIPVGILGLFLILIVGIFCGSSVGFIEFGIPEINKGYDINEVINDYYFKPAFWILLFGSIPTIITGGFLGYLIKMN
ncbi:hypothetical protein [Moheibacter sediminis]|uniref:Uncharacterized protein n=1 Tax=Moheibacter sediminis TaxID=1434700 RepID=A0A1W2A9S7_9FLAO|nr:hypothetical protein [Moheibacter sediminis]SMC57416.1 hypothetical protein SAMN06296427_10449 [Moheibacter sediminis]